MLQARDKIWIIKYYLCPYM